MTGTILIADDHPLFRQALAMAAAAVCPDARLVECANLPTALNEAVAADDLLLILLDLKMPGAEGYSGVALLHSEKPAYRYWSYRAPTPRRQQQTPCALAR